jgi:hypothetical protein
MAHTRDYDAMGSERYHESESTLRIRDGPNRGAGDKDMDTLKGFA